MQYRICSLELGTGKGTVVAALDGDYATEANARIVALALKNANDALYAIESSDDHGKSWASVYPGIYGDFRKLLPTSTGRLDW